MTKADDMTPDEKHEALQSALVEKTEASFEAGEIGSTDHRIRISYLESSPDHEDLVAAAIEWGYAGRKPQGPSAAASAQAEDEGQVRRIAPMEESESTSVLSEEERAERRAARDALREARRVMSLPTWRVWVCTDESEKFVVMLWHDEDKLVDVLAKKDLMIRWVSPERGTKHEMEAIFTIVTAMDDESKRKLCGVRNSDKAFRSFAKSAGMFVQQTDTDDTEDNQDG